MSPATGCGAVTRLAGIAQVDAWAQGHKPGPCGTDGRPCDRWAGSVQRSTLHVHQAQLGTRPADGLQVQCYGHQAWRGTWADGPLSG